MSDATSRSTWFLNDAAAGIERLLRHIHAAYQSRRAQRQAAADLRAYSDYELKDIGVARCEIDYKVTYPPKKSSRRPARDDAGNDPR